MSMSCNASSIISPFRNAAIVVMLWCATTWLYDHRKPGGGAFYIFIYNTSFLSNPYAQAALYGKYLLLPCDDVSKRLNVCTVKYCRS